jgi:N-acyl-D-aspartate/D-glutamate deacylase
VRDVAYDIVIKGGRIVDGTGGPLFRGDVAIGGERIVRVGRVDQIEADEVVDARGLVVSPGFIDIHSHSDFTLLENPQADSFVRQGITTVINGNCGFSAAPFNEVGRGILEKVMGVELSWRSTAEYFSRLEERGMAINAGTFTGLTNLLVSAMGLDAWDRAPTSDEMEMMKEMLAQALREGSFGLSSGLEYDPQPLVETELLVELCRVMAEHGGIYATHVRSRDVQVVAAAEEAAAIGERAGVPVEGVHWGARFPSDGKTVHIVEIVEAARERGVDMAFNQVPWTIDENGIGWCGCSLIEPITMGSEYTKKGGRVTLEMLKDRGVVEHLRRDLPNRQYGPILAGRRGLLDSWDRVLLAHCEKSPQFNGRSLREIGDSMGKDPFDALIDILVADGEDFERVWGAVGITSLWDTEASLLHPDCSVTIDSANDSTSGPLSERPIGESTTRAYGQLPYFFRKWVVEDRVLSLEDAVRKCTGLPSQRVRLMDRGLLRPGMRADVVVWDPMRVKNNATWENPRRYPDGIHRVMVNGAIVVEDNVHTGVLGGESLRLAGA